MVKVLVMLLPWLMAKVDQLINHMLRRNRIGAFAETDEDMSGQGRPGGRKTDGDM